MKFRKEINVEKQSVFGGWVNAAANYTPGTLNESENAQFERAKIYEEHAKRFDFVLGGKLYFGE